MNIDIIVPVLGRPEHAKVFIDSLDRSYDKASHQVQVYAMCEQVGSSDFEAWDMQSCAWATRGHTFAEKVNYGYQLTDAEWVLLVGTDVRFHEGWVNALEDAIARNPEVWVLGTKDFGNPRVMAGAHTCHPVIGRDYIDRLGSSWDGPGVVCHEYHHCFVDDEIVLRAKQLNAWMPTEAVIEHLHPYWGKAEHDEVYAEGESWMEIDQIEWLRRVKQYAPELLS